MISGPGGYANRTPTTRVFGEIGSRCTVTTFVALAVTVTKPSGVCTVSGTTTHKSPPRLHTVAALVGAVQNPTSEPAPSPAARITDVSRRWVADSVRGMSVMENLGSASVRLGGDSRRGGGEDFELNVVRGRRRRPRSRTLTHPRPSGIGQVAMGFRVDEHAGA